jgi:hypothetical protein
MKQCLILLLLGFAIVVPLADALAQSGATRGAVCLARLLVGPLVVVAALP